MRCTGRVELLTTGRSFVRNDPVSGIAGSLTRWGSGSVHRSVVSNEHGVSDRRAEGALLLTNNSYS
jgi:hypothetical protein